MLAVTNELSWRQQDIFRRLFRHSIESLDDDEDEIAYFSVHWKTS